MSDFDLGLYIEAEQHYIAVLHDVLSLKPASFLEA